MMQVIRKFYDWVLSWAHSPYSFWALGLISFIESSVFPIPPDVLLIALCLARPLQSWVYATWCTVMSVLGGGAGYAIGYAFFEFIGKPVLTFYGVMDKYTWLEQIYQRYDALAVFVAGFTPIPYKLFTIAAGACHINIWVFLLVSFCGRGLRFYLLAGLLRFYGEKIKNVIDQYFNLLTLVFVGLMALGFVLVSLI